MAIEFRSLPNLGKSEQSDGVLPGYSGSRQDYERSYCYRLFSSVSSITHLEYLPAQSLLAEAVPEERKITPAAHTFTSFANLSKCLCAV
jgi:hypothetical protein